MIKMIITWLKRIIGGAILLMILFSALFWGATKRWPLPDIKIDPSTVVLDRHGDVLRHFANDEGIFRHWVEIDDVSDHYLNALIAYEDRFFYHHIGVNPLATIRALFQWIQSGNVVSGSSTITMQVARLIDPHQRTIAGKIKQMFRALQLELAYSKDEILTIYLNIAPMGGNIEGVETASWRYFSKRASQLNLSESALLVALPQRPSLYRPDRYPEQAKKARNKVLDRMVHAQLIDEKEARTIQKNPVEYDPQATQFHAPLLSDQLRRADPQQHRIESTIDSTLQKKVEHYIKARAERWPAHLSSAILIVNNQTHEVVTYVGSVDLFDHDRFGYVDMASANRSPGSTLKPFAYGMAFDYGIIHEASLLTDLLRSFDGYSPKNFDGHFHGAVTVAEALQRSLNIPIVQLFQHLTPHRFIKKMRQAGVTILIDQPNLSVILGGVGITLEEQVRLFSSLATEGELAPLIKHIPSENSDARETILTQSSTPHRLMSAEASWLISQILSDIRPSSHRYQKRSIAWKTGTSYGYRDAWAIGVSPDWTIGVWVGRPDGVPNVGTLANQIATPILFDLFTFMPKDQHQFNRPYTVTDEIICWPSGRLKSTLPTSACEKEYSIRALSGKIPPTLYDSKGESPHLGWPIAFKKEDSIGMATTKIETLADKSILYRRASNEEKSIIPLQASGSEPFHWYLNGVLLPKPQLVVGELPLGRSRLTVTDRYQRSDSIEIDVRLWDSP